MSVVGAGRRLRSALSGPAREQPFAPEVEAIDEIAMRNGHMPHDEDMGRGCGQPITGAKTAMRRNRERVLMLPARHRAESLREWQQLSVADLEFLVRYHEEQAASAKAELARRAA